MKPIWTQVGLATDVAGGYSPSMLSAIRNAVINSKALRMLRIDRARRASSQLTEDGSPAADQLPSLSAAVSVGDQAESNEEAKHAPAASSQGLEGVKQDAEEDNAVVGVSPGTAGQDVGSSINESVHEPAEDSQCMSGTPRAENRAPSAADAPHSQDSASSSEAAPQTLASSVPGQRTDSLGFNFATLGISFGSRDELANLADGPGTSSAASGERHPTAQTAADGNARSRVHATSHPAGQQPEAARTGQADRSGAGPAGSSSGSTGGIGTDAAAEAANGDAPFISNPKSARETLDYKEAFWLATMGGAQALGLEVRF